MHDTPSVEVLAAVSADDLAAIALLLPQLSGSAVFDADRIRAVVAHEGTDLLVARMHGTVIGMATVVAIPLPTGRRGHVEDVVVDGALRGRGVARALLDAAITLARQQGLLTLDLTSRPSREAALRLYESVGFRRRDTNVLRLTP